jgi:hypothetical protein
LTIHPALSNRDQSQFLSVIFITVGIAEGSVIMVKEMVDDF